MMSSDDDPLMTLAQPSTHTISGTLRVRSTSPIFVDDVPDLEFSAVSTVPASSRARMAVHSVSSTILDTFEEDLEISAVFLVSVSFRSLRRLRLNSVRAHDESLFHESLRSDVVIPVMSDTVSDPDLIDEEIDNVEEGAEESEVSSSGVDSIVDNREAYHAVGDVSVSDTNWDELIVDRTIRVGFVRLDRADLVCLIKSRVLVMKSSKFLRGAYCSLIRRTLTKADLRYAVSEKVRVLGNSFHFCSEDFSVKQFAGSRSPTKRRRESIYSRWH